MTAAPGQPVQNNIEASFTSAIERVWEAVLAREACKKRQRERIEEGQSVEEGEVCPTKRRKYTMQELEAELAKKDDELEKKDERILQLETALREVAWFNGQGLHVFSRVGPLLQGQATLSQDAWASIFEQLRDGGRGRDVMIGGYV